MSFNLWSKIVAIVVVLNCLIVDAVPWAVGGDFKQPSIQFIGTADIQGTASDLSGYVEKLVNGEPHNRFGGISALEYTGHGNRYIALPDRGPDDGATGYECRYQVIEINITPDSPKPVQVVLKETHVLKDFAARNFTGSAAATKCTESCAGRLDPEGVRVGRDGRIFVSDEYGPTLIAFDTADRELARFQLPLHLHIQNASDSKTAEIQDNSIGRVSNRGMEGLALSGDGKFLYGIMQSCLLQDGERTESGKVLGRYCRIIEVEISSGKIREFAYPIDAPENGVSEILAWSPGQFLVLERDGNAGVDALYRKLTWIDVSEATDIVSVEALPLGQLPTGVQAVQKQEFLDFLNPAYGLAGEKMPEKIEGLTFGPTLPDGRKTLVLAIDNDFEADKPSFFWVFAVGAEVAVSAR